MKRSLGICLVICSALIGLGSALQCYSCQGPTKCTTQQQCGSGEDTCLKLIDTGGKTYRQCLKYSECNFNSLSGKFPQVSKFTFDCCNSDLCNSAPSSTASSVIGLLASVAVMWWCIH
ncbi:CD59 glycoprotein isoform X2 [Morone saxatilis]|uniref:CD59 glycoprotein isoform X2 n=1 Tax=Morone saxatilis TaxID=34816 RepID=UPI0015E1F14D|nr:CD59 glycoprotein isoform X2 [Morone saxatilis]